MMTEKTELSKSPFLHYTTQAAAGDLAVVYLRRDIQIPVILSHTDSEDTGYAEGKVVNTRFGSFPHSTLIGQKWGSQIRASAVDTGSRGREPSKKDKKRKRRDVDQDEPAEAPISTGPGFIHLLPPTPENWTLSLPHRTQVVYTPDSSYVLQRLRVRPGTVIIEAGAGSGSFTHAACRAVCGRRGKVVSFEFHEPRYQTLLAELQSHRLMDIVELRHRDVCENGFGGSEHKASAVFLDLPAPWLALKHLTRAPNGPLAKHKAIRLCTFSPCIEQVQRTTAEMRKLGWIEIETVELSSRRIEVRRERVGYQEEGIKGGHANAASVEEAVSRLATINKRIIQSGGDEEGLSRQEKMARQKEGASNRKLHIEGTLVHRPEADAKLHTSWLTFALLPLEWTEADEARVHRQVMDLAEKAKAEGQAKKKHPAGISTTL